MGQMDLAVRAELHDCTITLGPDTTTVHTELPDQRALVELIRRMMALRLEIIRVLLVTPPAL
jgi:hypothetical protein